MSLKLRSALRPELWAPLLLAPLLACPPQLRGEPCNDDCACPQSETCLLGADGGSTCQDGTNACGHGDAGVGSDAGALPDSGIVADSGIAFAGTVTLNGGAQPQQLSWVYGSTGGFGIDGGGYQNVSLFAAVPVSAGGAFSFAYPIDGGSDSFVAEYDSQGAGQPFPVGNNATSLGTARLAAGLPSSLVLNLEVQTSTCFSVTTEFQGADGGQSFLLLVGAQLANISDGSPVTSPSALDSATVTLDAGGAALVAALAQPLPLSPQPIVPLFASLTNAWLAQNTAGAPLPNTGDFQLSYTDALHAAPQYPAGTCDVAYAEPLGFPSALTLDGQSTSALWAASHGATHEVAWTSPVAPVGLRSIYGSLVTINDGSGALIYTNGATAGVTSPLKIASARVPAAACPAAPSGSGSTPSFCTLTVTTFFRDGHRKGVAFEGGSAALAFQTSP